MARFFFQLEAVLRHRERIEKDRQRDLALAEADLVHIERDLEALEQAARRNGQEVRGHLLGRLDMSYLAAHRRYMLGVQRKATAIAQQLAVQKNRVEEARRQLAEASKQKKILEKLKLRQFERWSADQARREAADLDELSTQLSYADITAQWEDAT